MLEFNTNLGQPFALGPTYFVVLDELYVWLAQHCDIHKLKTCRHLAQHEAVHDIQEHIELETQVYT